MDLREYTDSDAEATLTVFLRAIREPAAGGYSPDQVAAWAAEHGDLAAWAASRAAAHTQVAIIDGRLVGFTDLDDDGYVGHAVRGSRLWPTGGRDLDAGCNHRPRPTARDVALTTYASLTGKPLLERHGVVVTEERHFLSRDVELTNVAMRCELGAA